MLIMHNSWSKGFTKETHPSVMKISQTLISKKIDNFREWRNRMKNLGLIPKNYPSFRKSGDLAEYIGVILGDGNIGKFPRTERLVIVGNANNRGFIERYAKLTEKFFNKKPFVGKCQNTNAVRISLYQKKISKRLNIPCGNKKKINWQMPKWIQNNKNYLIRLLKGLFEAEGSLSIHIPTCTYNFQFRNNNKSLLTIMENGLKLLGYHPEIRINSVRLRKKQEVENFRKLINFRLY